MKICMVVQSHYPDDERVRREAECLERHGIAVDVICLRGPNETKQQRFGKIMAYRVLHGSRRESIFGYLSLSCRFALCAFFKMQKLFLKNRYSLVQVHNMPDFLVFVGIIQKIWGKPIVLDLHDLSPELFGSKWSDNKRPMLISAVRILERISCAFANHLITTSHGFRNLLIARGIRPEKITLIMNTADEQIFTRDKSRNFVPIEREAKLLYHGTVARRFGLTVAIEALAMLQSHIPGSTLQIYGKYDPSYRLELEQLIKDKGLQDSVFLGGYLSLEEIAKVIRKADFGVVPYFSDPFMDVALSSKTFEYVATGIPVMAAGLPSLRSIFPENCMGFFRPGDANDLAQRIAAMCKTPQLRQANVVKAWECLEGITWSVMSERYMNLILSLTNSRSKHSIHGTNVSSNL